MDLGTWLHRKELTQEEFASLAGISQGHVSKLVSRKCRRVSLDIALRIERATKRAVRAADLIPLSLRNAE